MISKLKKPHHKDSKNTKNTKKDIVRIALPRLNGAMSDQSSTERSGSSDLVLLVCLVSLVVWFL